MKIKTLKQYVLLSLILIVTNRLPFQRTYDKLGIILNASNSWPHVIKGNQLSFLFVADTTKYNSFTSLSLNRISVVFGAATTC